MLLVRVAHQGLFVGSQLDLTEVSVAGLVPVAHEALFLYVPQEFSEARFLDLPEFVGLLADQQSQIVDCSRGGFGLHGVGTESVQEREYVCFEVEYYFRGHLRGGDLFHAHIGCGRVWDILVEDESCLGQKFILQVFIFQKT